MDSFLRKGTIIMKFLFLCLLFLLSSCIDSDAVLSKNESEKIKVNDMDILSAFSSGAIDYHGLQIPGTTIINNTHTLSINNIK